MVKSLSEKEKALLVLKKATKRLEELEKEVHEVHIALNDIRESVNYIDNNLRRTFNEEENGGNIHKDCEYYNEETDCCYNYLMGKYCGLAFEVSRHDKCIDDMEVEFE